MKIKNRLTIISTSVFVLVFIIVSVVIFFAYKHSSTRIIYQNLHKLSLLTAYYYLEEDEMSKTAHNKIKTVFYEKIGSVEVRLYDSNNNIRYGKMVEDSNITVEVLRKARQQGYTYFNYGQWYYAGLFYKDNQGDFVVFLTEDNTVFETQANNLLLILILSLLLGSSAIFFISRVMSDIAYRPIRKVINQIKRMSQNSLYDKLHSIGTKDEVDELINTFNELLGRLEEIFSMQKNFVSYFSHEIKTPLAVIAGNLEVLGQKTRKPEEYQHIANEILHNVYEIETIMKNLKIISGLSQSQPVQEKFRLDELLWKIISKLSQTYQNFNPIIKLNISPENESILFVFGNESQIGLAIQNIIDNSIKYSDEEQIQIEILQSEKKLTLFIKDKGIGILPQEMNSIILPFFRGTNAKNLQGSGLGLSIAETVFKQHKITMKHNSSLKTGTTVTIVFPDNSI